MTAAIGILEAAVLVVLSAAFVAILCRVAIWKR